MKKSLRAMAAMSILISGFSFNGAAQTSQTSTNVTLHLTGATYTINYPVQTNQIISASLAESMGKLFRLREPS